MSSNKVKRIGMVGYGNLGKFLSLKIMQHEELYLDFVWNRTVSKIETDSDYDKLIAYNKDIVLNQLDDFVNR